MFKLYDPPEFEAAKQADKVLYAQGLPHVLDVPGSAVTEHVDAVVVGARCAGSATATALARAGRRVVALDRASFPSDTLSTHLLFLGGVVELQRLGALERVLELGPPKLTEASMGWGPFEAEAGYTPVEGIDYALCVRRPGLDAALVATARDAGAQVREQSTVREVLVEDGRAAGVRYRDGDGREHELRAPLVVGADGRRSAVARAMGADAPELESPNGRGVLFRLLARRRRRIALAGVAVAPGPRAGHRLPVRRRPGAGAADAPGRAGRGVRRRPGGRVRPHRRLRAPAGRAAARGHAREQGAPHHQDRLLLPPLVRAPGGRCRATPATSRTR